jgi:hypothetical protein
LKVIVTSVRKVPSEKQADFPILTALLAKSNVLLPPPDSKKNMKSQRKTLKRIRKQRSLRHKTQLAKSQIRSPLFQIFRSTKWL